MSQIVRCCLCDQRVRIPDVESEAWVRCPHCREEYQLAKVAKDLPPRLQVIGDRPVVVDSEAVSDPQALTPSADSSEFLDVGPVENSALVASPPVVVPRMKSEDQGFDKAAVRSPQKLHAKRVKRRSQGGGWAFAKVFLGGIAGLFLGQIILWWLPAPYQSDPLDLAQKLPASLAFLKPPGLKLVEPTEDPQDVDPALAEPQRTSSNTVLPQEITRDRVPATDLKHSLHTAMAANMTFDDISVPEQKHVESWYGNLRNLAFCATSIGSMDAVNAEVVDEMNGFLEKVVADASKVSSIAASATQQLQADPPRDQDGVVVVGIVREIRPAGELFRTSISMQETEVDVISRTDPRVTNVFNKGDNVLLLGVVLAHPAGIQGYKGSDEVVVFGGFPLKIGAGT